MNEIKYFNERNKIMEILDFPLLKKEQLITSCYKKYIGDNKCNEEILLQLTKENKKILVISNAGSGKTYMVDSLAKTLFKENMRRKGILCEEDFELPLLPSFEDTPIETKEYLPKDYTGLGDFIKLDTNFESLPWNDDDSFEYETIQVCCILCPSRNQNLQNEEDISYNMVSLTSENKRLQIEQLLGEDKTISAVFEKVTEIGKVFDIAKGLRKKIKLTLMIDEAHLLIEQKHFRTDAIKNINKVADKIIENGGSVFYITATPQSLLTLDIDCVVGFNPSQTYKMPTKEVVINANINESNDLLSFASQRIINNNNPCLVRCNNFNQLNSLKNSLIKNRLVVLTVDSTQKGFLQITEADGSTRRIFDNIVYNEIINNQNLPDEYNGEKLHCIISTAVLDVGTNIKKFGFKENPNLTPVYIINNEKQCYISTFIQFFNRIRYNVNKYEFILNIGKTTQDFIPLDDILSIELQKANAVIKNIEPHIELFMKQTNNTEEVFNKINQFLNITNIKGEPYHLYCIKFNRDSLQLELDKEELFKKCYDKYNQQLFFNIYEFYKSIKEEFNVNIELNIFTFSIKDANNFMLKILRKNNIIISKKEICDIKGNDLKILLIDKLKKELGMNIKIIKDGYYLSNSFKNEDEDEVDILRDILENNDLKEQVLKNQIEDDRISKLQNTITWKNLNEMLILDINIDSAINLCINNDIKGMIEAKDKAQRNIIIKFKDNEFNTLQQIILKEKKVKDILNLELYKKINEIINNKILIKAMKRMFALELDIKEIKLLLNKYKNYNDLNKELDQIQFIYYNNCYNKNKESYIPAEQKCILDSLYKFNKAGNLVQTKITKKVLDDLNKELKMKTGISKYTNSNIKQIIELCFDTRLDDKDKKIKVIKSFKLKRKES